MLGPTPARVTVLLLAAALAAAAPAAAGDLGSRAPSHRQLQDLLLARLVEQVATQVAGLAPGARIGLRAMPGHELMPLLQDSLAVRLARGGRDVWVVDPACATNPDSAFVVELALTRADFALSQGQRSFLSLGTGRMERRASLQLSAKASTYASGDGEGFASRSAGGSWAGLAAGLAPGSARGSPPGSVLWSGNPTVQSVDWFPASRKDALSTDTPAWVVNALKQPSSVLERRSPWVERGVVLGLLGGVILVYVAGAS